MAFIGGEGSMFVQSTSLTLYGHSKLRNIMLVVIRVHVILRSFVVLTWMRDKREVVKHVTLWNDTKAYQLKPDENMDELRG